MAVLHFMYNMEIKYEEPVERCHFTIKCIPREDTRQHLLGYRLSLLPRTEYSCGEDSFGNRQIYGCGMKPHDRFVFQAEGDVEIFRADYEEENRGRVTGAFRVPHGMCIPGPGLREYFHSLELLKCESSREICMELMHRLYRDFSYVPGITGVHTTAEEAWEAGCGVCQDYAHIYITLLRMAGIPARYVCGLLVGEGASHGWAEALCDDKWESFDPTNDCVVSDSHIKLGHGRDAADCAINRGLMWNGGRQTQNISVHVERKK